jgi:hypothetical protein
MQTLSDARTNYDANLRIAEYLSILYESEQRGLSIQSQETSTPAPPTDTTAVATDRERIEADWRLWLGTLYPAYTRAGFAPRHIRLWDWLWSIRRGVSPRPFVPIWPRGGAKSTTAELGGVSLGARSLRNYCLYISRTQDQADDHVGNMATMMESPTFGEYYPAAASKLKGKFGSSRGWRRNRIRAANGFTVDAIGLDTAIRGRRLDIDRPDLIILDDIDSDIDSPAEIEKNISALTKKILPAGSNDLAVLAVQNLVHPYGIFARLARHNDQDADFLADRIVDGPTPAIEGYDDEQRADGKFYITAGTPTWKGQDLATCQRQVHLWGRSAFLSEAQHEVDEPTGGIYEHVTFLHCKPADVPELEAVEVWVDPAVTNTDKSDSMGIQCDGRGVDGRIYRLYSWEGKASPLEALKLAVEIGMMHGATTVGIETDQGGDTWESVYAIALRHLGIGPEHGEWAPAMAQAKAGAGYGPKAHRASQMLIGYETGVFVHVIGTHRKLELALRRFGIRKPYDLADAAFWSWTALVEGREQGVAVVRRENTITVPEMAYGLAARASGGRPGLHYR